MSTDEILRLRFVDAACFDRLDQDDELQIAALASGLAGDRVDLVAPRFSFGRPHR